MRSAFARSLVDICNTPDTFFLTGDLGFMALESVRDAFGNRFINAGVAEQNMVGVAAGLAREGFTVFAYSIAPFIYARPFEQIRNDLCPENLRVCLVGNGGGYAYGVMGGSHHALEDMGVLAALGVRVIAPAFNADIPYLLETLSGTTYLRLGRQELPSGVSSAGAVPSAYAPWRNVLGGENGVIAALGPLAGVAWSALHDAPYEDRPSVWAVCEFSDTIPDSFLTAADGKSLFIIEEHVRRGGLGEYLALALCKYGVKAASLRHNCARGYSSAMKVGSQAFYRAWCGLDAASIRRLACRGGGR